MAEKQHNVLVVDDEPIGLKAISESLDEAGFAVTEANNGQEALDILDQNLIKFSAIVLDRIMPVMDGMEFLKKFAKRPKIAKIPVIVLTAMDEPKEIINAIKAGAFDYLTKPVDRDVLVQLVTHAIERRQ